MPAIFKFSILYSIRNLLFNLTNGLGVVLVKGNILFWIQLLQPSIRRQYREGARTIKHGLKIANLDTWSTVRALMGAGILENNKNDLQHNKKWCPQKWVRLCKAVIPPTKGNRSAKSPPKHPQQKKILTPNGVFFQNIVFFFWRRSHISFFSTAGFA